MSRVNDALSSLVGSLLPAIIDEDEQEAEQRHADGIELARSILHEHGKSGEAYEPGYVSDLIKKKLWRENRSPDKAVRFTNLYTRLLTLPILTRKWAILHLLHQISQSGGDDVLHDEASPTLGSPIKADGQRNLGKSTETAGGLRANLQDASSARINQRSSKGNNQGTPGPENAATNGQDGHDTSRRPVTTSSPNAPLHKQSHEPSDVALLRDLPFTLQGVSSTNLEFSSPNTLSLPSTLPLPIISLLHTLAEPSLLYRSLSDFVESRDVGLVGQSLRAAIGIELRSYLGLIATLETEIRRAIASVNDTNIAKPVSKSGVTLKRCVVWTRDATMGLRLMSLMAEESKSKKGGQLISMIHFFSISYGDPFVSAFAERMLSHLTKPFYDMLRQWIYDGELSDPYHEFFVIERDPDNDTRELDPRRVLATSVWEDKYKLDKELVPSIITDEFAEKIFLIGKSLNFIRYGCGDSSWVEAYSKDASKELKYGDTATLETSIDNAYKTTMARLIHLMDHKFKLFEHLTALKKYLLLGQGDFVALLMESLSSNLDRPAGSQYRHTLTAQLEHAIRGSNAQYDSPDVLRRLDARLLELSHGDIGWDVFTLEYKVDAPVDVVITSWASKQYLIVFNFLWRIKRVEFALGSTWRRCMTGARGVLASVDDKLGRDWKIARCCIAEMIHFINQLQYYILFEVIEASWDALQAAIHKPDCTLDDLITAHTKYLKAITHKGLLGSTRSTITGTREDSFTSQLHYLLKIMLSYKDAVDGLYSFSVAQFTRRQELHARLETRSAATTGQRGAVDFDAENDFSPPAPGERLRSRNGRRYDEQESGGGGADSPLVGLSSLTGTSTGSGDDQMLPALRKRLHELSVDFRGRLATLLGDLMVQPDPDMKFLGVVMNFNDVYRPHRRKKRGQHEKDKDKEKKTPAGAGGGEAAAAAGAGRAESRQESGGGESRGDSRLESRAGSSRLESRAD